MVENQAEQYREEMEKFYKASCGEDISFDTLSFVEDKKGRFVVGKYQKKETIPQNDSVYYDLSRIRFALGYCQCSEEAYERSQGTIFCMPLKDGKLEGKPVVFEAKGMSKHEITSPYAASLYRGGIFDVNIFAGHNSSVFVDGVYRDEGQRYFASERQAQAYLGFRNKKKSRFCISQS